MTETATGHEWHAFIWVAVQAKFNEEARAEKNITARGFAAWLPLGYKASADRPGKDRRTFPLFSGYLFAGFTRDQPFGPILTARGVFDVVRMSDTPSRVPHELLEALWTLRDDQGHIAVGDEVDEHGKRAMGGAARATTKARGDLIPGAQATVAVGRLQGYSGLVDGLGSARVTLLLEILGQKRKFSFPKSHVVAG